MGVDYLELDRKSVLTTVRKKFNKFRLKLMFVWCSCIFILIFVILYR